MKRRISKNYDRSQSYALSFTLSFQKGVCVACDLMQIQKTAVVPNVYLFSRSVRFADVVPLAVGDMLL